MQGDVNLLPFQEIFYSFAIHDLIPFFVRDRPGWRHWHSREALWEEIVTEIT